MEGEIKGQRGDVACREAAWGGWGGGRAGTGGGRRENTRGSEESCGRCGRALGGKRGMQHATYRRSPLRAHGVPIRTPARRYRNNATHRQVVRQHHRADRTAGECPNGGLDRASACHVQPLCTGRDGLLNALRHGTVQSRRYLSTKRHARSPRVYRCLLARCRRSQSCPVPRSCGPPDPVSILQA